MKSAKIAKKKKEVYMNRQSDVDILARYLMKCVTEELDIPDTENEITFERSNFPISDEGSITLEMPPELTVDDDINDDIKLVRDVLGSISLTVSEVKLTVIESANLLIKECIIIWEKNVPDVVTVHWDGKVLPGLDVRSSKEECLPVIASFHHREQLLAVPKLESSSGKHQTKAISTAVFDLNVLDNVQIMGCDTTDSNTGPGRFNGACAILEQTLGRELLLFTCRSPKS
ncbi:hypothetical protein QYM36_008125, partial [Artemia franciscana]